MPEIHLRAIFACCPNVRFKVEVKYSCLLTAISVLGRQLETAFVNGQDYGFQQEELGRAWRKCSNLKEIEFGFGFKLADIRAFCLYPKPYIKKALIQFHDENLLEIIDLFAHGTGGLEEIEDSFVQRNRLLHSFKLKVPSFDQETYLINT